MLIMHVALLLHGVSHGCGMTDVKYQEVVSTTQTGVPCGKTTRSSPVNLLIFRGKEGTVVTTHYGYYVRRKGFDITGIYISRLSHLTDGIYYYSKTQVI